MNIILKKLLKNHNYSLVISLQLKQLQNTILNRMKKW